MPPRLWSGAVPLFSLPEVEGLLSCYRLVEGVCIRFVDQLTREALRPIGEPHLLAFFRVIDDIQEPVQAGDPPQRPAVRQPVLQHIGGIR